MSNPYNRDNHQAHHLMQLDTQRLQPQEERVDHQRHYLPSHLSKLQPQYQSLQQDKQI